MTEEAGFAASVPPVIVVPYDPEWVARFEALRAPLWDAVREIALSIEHVGSTAVPGLAAKPIVDMTVVVPSPRDVPRAIAQLQGLGYRHRGDLGIAGREAFHAPPDLPAHRLYVCAKNSLALANHVALRDWLRSHPDDARAYGELKQQLAVRFRGDIDGYVDGKTDFIAEVLRMAGMAPDAVAAIAASNRKPG
jgi:GrpB-like predicted nucleotidyltransferase (UPF0157 family)